MCNVLRTSKCSSAPAVARDADDCGVVVQPSSFNTWCDSLGGTDTRMVVEGRFWLLEGCVFLLGSAGKITAVGLGMIVGSIWEPADHCWPDQSILVCYYTMYNRQTSPSVRRSWITTCLRCNHRLSDHFLLSRASIVNSWTYNICLFCVLFVSCCFISRMIRSRISAERKGLSVFNMSYSYSTVS